MISSHRSNIYIPKSIDTLKIIKRNSKGENHESPPLPYNTKKMIFILFDQNLFAIHNKQAAWQFIN